MNPENSEFLNINAFEQPKINKREIRVKKSKRKPQIESEIPKLSHPERSPERRESQKKEKKRRRRNRRMQDELERRRKERRRRRKLKEKRIQSQANLRNKDHFQKISENEKAT